MAAEATTASVEPSTTASDTPVAPLRSRNRPSRRTRRLQWFVALPLTVVTLIAGVGVIAFFRVQSAIDNKIQRFDVPASALPAGARPPATKPTNAGAATALNLLVFGSDSRISAGDPSQWQAGAQRTDAIMLVHIPADRSHVYVTSIPRDSWVPIPGHGTAKINAAFSWGGPALAIRTVEQLTGVRIDHMVITDFTGFAKITDLLGGVDVTVPQTTVGDTHGQGDNFTAGTHHMDGATALTYVRQRYNLPNGDFDRVKRQQNWIRSVIRTAIASGAASSPTELYALVDAMASSLSTDSAFSIGQLRSLALSLHGLGGGSVSFLTAPVSGTGWSPDHSQSIVNLDAPKASGLWAAIRTDSVQKWLTDASYPTLGSTVR